MLKNVFFFLLLTAYCLLSTSSTAQISIYAGAKRVNKGLLTTIKEGDRLLNQQVPDYEGALEVYEEIYKAEPKNALLNYKIAVCYLNTAYRTRAMLYLEDAFGDDTTISPEIYYLLGKSYQLNWMFKEAIGSYQKYKKVLSEKDLKKKKVSRLVINLFNDERSVELSSMIPVKKYSKNNR